MKNGLGLFIFQNGSYYQGNFISNKPNGFGRYVHENGDIFEGNFL